MSNTITIGSNLVTSPGTADSRASRIGTSEARRENEPQEKTEPVANPDTFLPGISRLAFEDASRGISIRTADYALSNHARPVFEEIGPNVHSAVAEVSSGRPVSASTPKAFEKELLTALKQSAAGDAGQPVPKEVTVGAKAFMAKERLFGTNPEGQIDANTRARWGGLKIVTVEGKQFVVMNRIIETKYDGDTEWKGSVPGDLVNVVAMKKNAAGQFVFDKFENAVAVPKTLTVALGCNYSNRGSKDQYYGVVEGKDVVEVLKSVYGATPVSGATIQVEKGAKAEFDPTVGRKWRTTSLHYALDRGSSAEILDGRPHQLDEDFNGYYHSTQGKFAPWLFGQVRGVFVAGKWKAALPLTPMPRT